MSEPKAIAFYNEIQLEKPINGAKANLRCSPVKPFLRIDGLETVLDMTLQPRMDLLYCERIIKDGGV